MRLRQFGVQLKSLAARSLRLVQIVFTAVPIHVEERAAVRHACKRAGILRVDDDGSRKHLPRKVKTFSPELVKKLASPQVVVVSLRIFGLSAGDGFLFLRREFYAQGLADAARDFILNFKNVLEFPVISFRPNGMARLRLNELRGD